MIYEANVNLGNDDEGFETKFMKDIFNFKTYICLDTIIRPLTHKLSSLYPLKNIQVTL